MVTGGASVIPYNKRFSGFVGVGALDDPWLSVGL